MLFHALGKEYIGEPKSAKLLFRLHYVIVVPDILFELELKEQQSYFMERLVI